jgi:REP element-mobilizing transposase RayT
MSKAEDFNLSLEVNTPNMPDGAHYIDADVELMPMAKRISEQTPHNMEIEADRIKYLYSNKPKKDGSSYVIGQLLVRNEVERAITEDYDYALIIFHPVWKNLNEEQKFIQLDKLLCGVKIDVNKKGEKTIKKNPFDCKEYMNNMAFWGAEKVMRTTEIVQLAIEQYIESKKEDSKNE